jgi:hypothetical protein
MARRRKTGDKFCIGNTERGCAPLHGVITQGVFNFFSIRCCGHDLFFQLSWGGSN